MKPESLLYKLTELGETYNKMTRNEQEQYILDLINNLLDTDNLKSMLLETRNKIYFSRIDRAECPLCGSELHFNNSSIRQTRSMGKTC